MFHKFQIISVYFCSSIGTSKFIALSFVVVSLLLELI